MAAEEIRCPPGPPFHGNHPAEIIDGLGKAREIRIRWSLSKPAEAENPAENAQEKNQQRDGAEQLHE